MTHIVITAECKYFSFVDDVLFKYFYWNLGFRRNSVLFYCLLLVLLLDSLAKNCALCWPVGQINHNQYQIQYVLKTTIWLTKYSYSYVIITVSILHLALLYNIHGHVDNGVVREREGEQRPLSPKETSWWPNWNKTSSLVVK